MSAGAAVFDRLSTRQVIGRGLRCGPMPSESTFRAEVARALAQHEPYKVVDEGSRDAAVLIPLFEDPEPTVIFTVRTEAVSSHRGQISFPGGSVEPGDVSFAAAALRETREEIGIEPGAVEILGELDTNPTYVTGFTITPFVGWLERRPEVAPNPLEFAEVLFVPLAELNDSVRQEPGFFHGGREYPTEAWLWNDHVIWGVTARVVRHLLTLLGEAGLVEPPGGEDPWLRWTLPPRTPR